MVRKLQDAWQANWPMLVLVALLAGGPNFALALIGRMVGIAVPDETTKIMGKLDALTEQVEQLRAGTADRWTASMETECWRQAGNELRKDDPDWQGPDVHKIKRELGPTI